MRMVRSVEAIASHRNGVSGVPFHVVAFEDAGGRSMVGMAFGHDRMAVGILDRDLLAAGDIAFGSNSWRYESYGPEIRALVDTWEAEGRPEPTQGWSDRVLGDAGFFEE